MISLGVDILKNNADAISSTRFNFKIDNYLDIGTILRQVKGLDRKYIPILVLQEDEYVIDSIELSMQNILYRMMHVRKS